MDFVKDNPAIITGVVRAIALGLVILGFQQLTPEQEAALVVVISLVITLITSRLTVAKAVGTA